MNDSEFEQGVRSLALLGGTQIITGTWTNIEMMRSKLGNPIARLTFTSADCVHIVSLPLSNASFTTRVVRSYLLAAGLEIPTGDVRLDLRVLIGKQCRLKVRPKLVEGRIYYDYTPLPLDRSRA